ncbi:RNA polymerase sigma factor [Segetibacter koreensis]|uniref:RNA polymerase sigma factor n=1 Tax=Segetibacter koreensis TaxID=398037 RepID=UPI001FDFD2E5|nr:sigma-70 family RNA polymerase sigma factor [Segetibacter koreensis]
MSTAQRQNITQVINTYSKRLMGFIRKRVVRESDAEDILQDVFYQLIQTMKPIEEIGAWLFAVARNKITDQQRKHKPDLFSDIYNEAGDEDEIDWKEILFDNSNNPETEYLRSLFWEELNNSLQELPAEQRYVFILNELEGLSFKEIAQQTGETVNTLLSRKRYAVLHLRNKLRVLHDEILNY